MTPARMILAGTLLLVAVASFVFVRVEQGSGGTFVMNQRNAQVLTPAGVERVLVAAPDPVTHARGIRARCAPSPGGELHDPWTCTIDYRSGRRITYRVDVRLNGSYTGDDEVVRESGRTHRDTGVISGCCIVVP